ncbi:UNVERIFIED_CONTAM: hypothetical protein HDU68_004301, partial [Siphonaria sp. JEL0065]
TSQATTEEPNQDPSSETVNLEQLLLNPETEQESKLRKRKAKKAAEPEEKSNPTNVDDKETDSVKDDEEKLKQKKEFEKRERLKNPLYQFTALPPKSLRDAQDDFKNVVAKNTRSTMSDDGNMILLKLKTLDECRQAGATLTAKINKVHAKVIKQDKFSQKIGKKIMDIYNEASVAGSLEKRLITSLLDDLKALESTLEGSAELERKKKRKLEEKAAASSLNLKKSRMDDDIPGNNGAAGGSGSAGPSSAGVAGGGSTPVLATPQNLLPKGSQVVVKPDKDFILAFVTGWRADKGRYEVEDADAGDDPTNPSRRKYLFLPKQVLLIPHIAPREFLEGHTVLALYPQTTCFYKGKVVLPASKNIPKTHYSVLFEDDGPFPKHVPVLSCLDYPKTKKKE